MPASQNLCYNCFSERQDITGDCPYCGYDNIENRAKYPTALKAGSILNGQYIVGRVLGQGGFGITYLALDYQLNIKVAIKEYIPDGMATRLPETTLVSVYAGEKQDNFNYGAERFLDEARVLAKFIGNKNIAGVKSYFSENNTAYFVMDYIEGISFKNYIKNRGGRVAYTDALRVLMPVMDALAAVHREGFIHRDVTPDNIYITKDNEIKLLDFGSARYSLGDKSRSLDVILKAGYAPKEQYTRRGKQGPYTDIYSLAACFYASITGYLPPESLDRIDDDDIVDISTRGIKIPPDLEDAIMKGLEVRAEDRWQSMEEFKASIEGADASSAPPVTASTSSLTTGASTTATGTPPVTINTSPVITGAGTGESISAWQTTGQQFSGQQEQPPQYTAGQPAAAEQRNIQADLLQTSRKQAPDPIENKTVPFLEKYRAAVIISAVACLILIMVIIKAVGNNSGNEGSVVPAGNIEGASDEDDYVFDLQSDDTLELPTPVAIEPIQIMMDSKKVPESIFTEISNLLSIPLEVSLVPYDEIQSAAEMSFTAGERSIFFTSGNGEMVDLLKVMGATVIQPDNYKWEYFIIMPCVEDDIALQIVNTFNKVTASIHVKDKEYSASDDKPAGSYTGDILNGKRSGGGSMFYSDGSQYHGGWKDDLYSGYGFWYSPSGSRYEGDFVNGLPTSNVQLIYGESDQYFEELIEGGYSSQGAETEAIDKATDKAAEDKVTADQDVNDINETDFKVGDSQRYECHSSNYNGLECNLELSLNSADNIYELSGTVAYDGTIVNVNYEGKCYIDLNEVELYATSESISCPDIDYSISFGPENSIIVFNGEIFSYSEIANYCFAILQLDNDSMSFEFLDYDDDFVDYVL